jgi:hypothetical protein
VPKRCKKGTRFLTLSAARAYLLRQRQDRLVPFTGAVYCGKHGQPTWHLTTSVTVSSRKRKKR